MRNSKLGHFIQETKEPKGRTRKETMLKCVTAITTIAHNTIQHNTTQHNTTHQVCRPSISFLLSGTIVTAKWAIGQKCLQGWEHQREIRTRLCSPERTKKGQRSRSSSFLQ
ncbi:hypothetical protein MVEG_02028 [Podila verticillata NRRL 6337]|nr:hypothetical protein MVEG_02028 [Podila verticillata NRRL 6337]